MRANSARKLTLQMSPEAKNTPMPSDERTPAPAVGLLPGSCAPSRPRRETGPSGGSLKDRILQTGRRVETCSLMDLLFSTGSCCPFEAQIIGPAERERERLWLACVGQTACNFRIRFEVWRAKTHPPICAGPPRPGPGSSPCAACCLPLRTQLLCIDRWMDRDPMIIPCARPISSDEFAHDASAR